MKWMPMSIRKTMSIIRFRMNSTSVLDSGGGRKPTSYGVITAVKSSAVHVTTSHTFIVNEWRGSIRNHGWVSLSALIISIVSMRLVTSPS